MKPGDIVLHHGKKAQVETVFVDKGIAGARICYFPQPGVAGPGWPLVRLDQLHPVARTEEKTTKGSQ